jgi:flagellar basal-body rod modification protein FlgD
MATTPVSPAQGVSNAATSLTLNDLLQVLLTELTHQDPLKPVDDTAFMGQIAQFASLESTQETNQGVQQLLTLQALNQSVGLLGRTVSATSSGGSVVAGTVTSLTLNNGVPQMTITTAGGTAIPNVSIGQLLTVNH